MENRIEQAAEALADLRLRRNGVRPPITDLPDNIRPRDLREAYAVQTCLADILAAALGPAIGWKIGCTTDVMRGYLGIDHPCAGTMFASELRYRNADLKAGHYRKLGLECEIAVRLERDLSAGQDPRAAVGGVMTSVEIVEERFADFTSAASETLIADNFFAAGCVLGEEMPLVGELKHLSGGFRVNGAAAAYIGKGAMIMGDPLAALSWLAVVRTPHGGLKAGQVVTLGSVVKTIYPNVGDVVEASFDGLSPVSVVVS